MSKKGMWRGRNTADKFAAMGEKELSSYENTKKIVDEFAAMGEEELPNYKVTLPESNKFTVRSESESPVLISHHPESDKFTVRSEDESPISISDHLESDKFTVTSEVESSIPISDYYPEVLGTPNKLENNTNSFEYTGEDLVDATDNKNNKLIKEILKSGISPNYEDKFGNTPIYLAAFDGNLEGVKLLVEMKATIDMKSKSQGSAPALHAALLNGHFDVAQYLLEKGADVNSVGFKGMRPVHIAASRGDMATLNLLKEYNCDVNVVSNNNDTPAHDAALGITKGIISGWDAMKWLIENGLRVELINEANNNIEDILDSSQYSYGTKEYGDLIGLLYPY